MTVRCRKMQEADAQSVAEIDKKCHLGGWSALSYKNECHNPLADYIVLEDEKEIFAFAGQWCVVDEAQIMCIGVIPEKQHHGYGNCLIKTLTKIAADKGCSSTTLEVKENNIPALKLYKKLDFAVTGRRENYYPDGSNALLMTKHY